ncbi:MAG TPA: PA14 domain-containing protein [Verrucomicrobiota bacterium]|nr:PA14 domain-containing protein [Verrucomicrobiota bacterium]HQB16823.1 PA14 domain-containing protein [Verrucomicrobiota bacterium]
MKRMQRLSSALRPLASLAVIAFLASSVMGEDVFIPSYTGASASADVTPEPMCEFSSAGISRFGTAVASSATPAPLLPSTSRRAVYGNGTGAYWSVTPTDQTVGKVTFSSLKNIGVYKLYITKGTSGNATEDLVANMTAVGGDLADTNGVGGTVIPLPVFQAGYPNNVWIHIGYLTNHVTSPTVTFTYASGSIGDNTAAGGRWYMDAVYFQYLDACNPDGVPVAPQVGVGGPLAQGLTVVNVTGVSEGATNVTVYSDDSLIGQTNYAAGFASGAVPVPTSPLVKDAVITAGQIKNGCVSTVPNTGPVVGGGANPSIKVLLSCYQNPANAGPIGANGFPQGMPYVLKASSFIASYNSAPIPGQQLVPDACWQTVTFQHGVDPAIDMNSGAVVNDVNPFCALDALIFSIDELDSGPYDIYVDQIMNGDTVVEDFESYEEGSAATIMAPNQSATFAPASVYLSAPNAATISTAHAYDGTKSCRIQWQWANASNQRWARVIANGASGGKVNPQLDTRLPITIRYLVLPVGSSASHKFNGTVGQITNSGPAWLGGTNVLGVAVTGPGPYTYQWSRGDDWLPNPTTNPTYVIDNYGYGITEADNGVYTVAVSDGTCTEIRSYAFTVQDPAPTITNQPVHRLVTAGYSGVVFSVGADGNVPHGYPLSYQWYTTNQELYGQNSAELTIANASLADVGGYYVVVMNSYGWTTSQVAQLSVTPVAGGTGTGLRGEYWTASYATNPFSGPATLTRTDATVDFNWDTGSPDPAISPDYFTARWYGQVQAVGDDTYTFYTVSDDGVRLWVNGQLLVNQWVNHAPWTNSAALALSGATKYDVLMEYYEHAGGAVAQLYWSTASGSVAYQPVLQSQLYPLTYAPPTIALTEPADATVVTLPATVTLSATVTTNLAAEINGVRFLVNGDLLATVNTPPYTHLWVDPPAGQYTLTAQAIYNQSSLVDSPARSLTVSAETSTPVTLTGLTGTTLSYTGGAGAQFILLMSPDLAAPMNTWTRVATNAATPGTFTIPVGAEQRAFYRIASE